MVLFPLVAGATAVAANSASAVPEAPTALEATPPERFFDSRPTGEKNQAGSFTEIQIAGVGDVPADAEAVIVNVAAVEAEAPGFVSVVPAGSTGGQEPGTSNLNVTTGQTIANVAIIPLSEGGAIEVFTFSTAHILVDVLGYIPAGADYTAVDLWRALDTRPEGAAADQTFDIDVIDEFGPDDAQLAIVNLTMIESEAGGFLTTYPKGGAFPPTSNLNVDGPDQTRAGLAIVPIGDDDSISLFTSVAGNLAVDVLGYLGGDADFNGLDPFARIVDTRVEGERVPADSFVNVDPTLDPAVPDEASFVLINVTAVEASDPGFITVWPNGLDQPEASNLNYGAGGTIANTVLVPLGADGTVNIYTQSEIHLLVDVIGWI